MMALTIALGAAVVPDSPAPLTPSGLVLHATVWLKTSTVVSYMFRNTDPVELRRSRTRQLMQMARYARAATPDELLGWGDVDVVRFNELYSALHELNASENALTSLSENV